MKANLTVGLVMFGLGMACGMALNHSKPVIVREYVEAPAQTHFHFAQPNGVYIGMDDRLFKLEVDGEWTGLTMVETEKVKEYKPKKRVPAPAEAGQKGGGQ